jgi:hypothetical protein
MKKFLLFIWALIVQPEERRIRREIKEKGLMQFLKDNNPQ